MRMKKFGFGKVVLCGALIVCTATTSAFALPASDLEMRDDLPVASQPMDEIKNDEPKRRDFIKWIDFNVTAGILSKVTKSHKILIENGITDIGSAELLAYLAVKNGNKFSTARDSVTLDKLVNQLKKGEREAIDKYAENKYFIYYVKSFHAVLDGIIDRNSGEVIGKHPIARGFWHSGFDDFGMGRNYGFKRKHLGHDLYGGVGTPIIAMEGGTITELGWNQYGGWRVGITSEDSMRYYYYAHLRKDKPFPLDMQKGDKVESGQVIGFLGNTGYSRKKNKNMSSAKPHLHFGMQIIFDESQKDGNGEIWIDVYQICKFLERSKVKVEKNADNEWESYLL